MSERPYDFRWGSASVVAEEFHIQPLDLKKAYLDGWIKARQPAWEDDEHRCQIVYCFEDVHRYMEDVLHVVSEDYVKRFWTTQELKDAMAERPRGPYAKRRFSIKETT